MKHLTLLLILLISGTVYSQKLKERLQGDWVCIGIVDSNGQPTKGKFGEPDEYLKFSFIKDKLSIREAPFDNGLRISLLFKKDESFDLLPGALIAFPERIYKVKKLNKEYLTLRTKDSKGDSITYHFINQQAFPYQADNQVIDNGVLVVKHLRLSKTETTSLNRAFTYGISNDTIYLSQRPTFEGGMFGYKFSYSFKLPHDFKQDELSDEMILEFDVSEGGAGNFKIVKELSDELNAEVMRVMQKLRKSWKPLVLNKKTITITMRFHLYFYMGNFEMQF